VWLFEAVLVRSARRSLRLLPAPHHRFDLAAYWASSAASRCLGGGTAQELLARGPVP